MVRKMENFFLIAFLAALLVVVQSSTSSPIQNDLLEDFTAELTSLRIKVDMLEARNPPHSPIQDNILNELNKSELRSLRAKVDILETRNIENEAKILKQGQEISELKSKIDTKQESDHPVRPFHDPLQSLNDDNGNKVGSIGDSSLRALLPSSCRDLSQFGHSFDGLYLVKNPETRKIETIFCDFGTSISQELIGEVDVKTKIVHFYVQRSSIYNVSRSVIPWEIERLNEGGAMNLASGIFTVPVGGIYHFEFTGIRNSDADYVGVQLRVNGVNLASIFDRSSTSTDLFDTVSLTASLRLKENDMINLYLIDGSMYDDAGYLTQFAGWLVEEDF